VGSRGGKSAQSCGTGAVARTAGRESRLGSPARRGYVRRVLQAFIEELRAILKRRGPELYAQFPEVRRPCHTCAFNPATDCWRGADTTAARLMDAIERDQPFYCHENLPYVRGVGWVPVPAKMRLCAGWFAVMGHPETKSAFTRAVMKVPPPKSRRGRDGLWGLVRP
jgi:hypothetical protein